MRSTLGRAGKRPRAVWSVCRCSSSAPSSASTKATPWIGGRTSSSDSSTSGAAAAGSVWRRVSGGVAARSCSPGSGRWPGRVTRTSPPRRAGQRVDRDLLVAGQRGADEAQALGSQRVADLPGLGVAVVHGVDHLVVRAGAHRVVRGVAHHRLPRHVQRLPGPEPGRRERRPQGLGLLLEHPLGSRRGLADVDPVGGDAGQQVGAGAAAQLAPPPEAGRPWARPATCSLQGGQAHVEAPRTRRGDGLEQRRQTGLVGEVVGAVHQQDRVVAHEVLDELDPRVEPGEERARVVRHAGAVAVAGRQVLGPHGRAVRRLPPEPGPVDRARHAAPHDGVVAGRPGRAAAASGRCGRTCRAGSRRPSRRPPGRPARRPGPSRARGRARGSRPRRGTRRAACTTGPSRRARSGGAPAARPPARAAARGSRPPRPPARRAGSG